jgi:hypothetical protein
MEISFNEMVRKLQIEKAGRLCTVPRPTSIAERERQGDGETGRQGDRETGRQRDRETEGRRDGETDGAIQLSLCLSVSLSYFRS